MKLYRIEFPPKAVRGQITKVSEKRVKAAKEASIKSSMITPNRKKDVMLQTFEGLVFELVSIENSSY